MKPSNAFRYLLLATGVLAGCDANASRPEYTGNGQGGVDIRPVPYLGPSRQATLPTGADQSRSDSLETQVRQQQVQIESLEDLIRRQEEEIRQLKGQPPATNPAAH